MFHVLGRLFAQASLKVPELESGPSHENSESRQQSNTTNLDDEIKLVEEEGLDNQVDDGSDSATKELAEGVLISIFPLQSLSDLLCQLDLTSSLFSLLTSHFSLLCSPSNEPDLSAVNAGQSFSLVNVPIWRSHIDHAPVVLSLVCRGWRNEEEEG